ncbi:MAG: 50S ribosome-binding GTPase, partial [Planctomycetota bacterium]|nr:50S ribosome-binding GTPase [Planctomycetota bacterium]
MRHRLHPDDVIAALTSAPGPAPRGIVRISGADTANLLSNWFVPDQDTATTTAEMVFARRMPWRTPGTIAVPDLWQPLRVDLHYWPGSRSYTGERLAELHLIGSPLILEMVLAELFRRGARPAEPGEFTLRAFLAGRIDLAQAEAVLGVIDAADDSELRVALGQLAGGLSNALAQARNDLLDLLADLEAGLDFADEAIEFVGHTELVARLQAAAAMLRPLIEQSEQRQRSEARWRVVLAGAPNAGKSTLFNALLGRSAAIVSNESGTTRDYLAAEMDVAGVPIVLIDTAGEQSSEHEIEQQAQEQRSEQIERADLVVWCAAWGEPHHIVSTPARAVLKVRTKADLANRTPSGFGREGFSAAESVEPDPVTVSAFDRVSVEQLKRAIAEQIAGTAFSGRQLIGSTAARTR